MKVIAWIFTMILHVTFLVTIVFGSTMLLLAFDVIPAMPNWKVKVGFGLLGLALIEMVLLSQRKT